MFLKNLYISICIFIFIFFLSSCTQQKREVLVKNNDCIKVINNNITNPKTAETIIYKTEKLHHFTKNKKIIDNKLISNSSIFDRLMYNFNPTLDYNFSLYPNLNTEFSLNITPNLNNYFYLHLSPLFNYEDNNLEFRYNEYFKNETKNKDESVDIKETSKDNEIEASLQFGFYIILTMTIFIIFVITLIIISNRKIKKLSSELKSEKNKKEKEIKKINNKKMKNIEEIKNSNLIEIKKNYLISREHLENKEKLKEINKSYNSTCNEKIKKIKNYTRIKNYFKIINIINNKITAAALTITTMITISISAFSLIDFSPKKDLSISHFINYLINLNINPLATTIIIVIIYIWLCLVLAGKLTSNK